MRICGVTLALFGLFLIIDMLTPINVLPQPRADTLFALIWAVGVISLIAGVCLFALHRRKDGKRVQFSICDLLWLTLVVALSRVSGMWTARSIRKFGLSRQWYSICQVTVAYKCSSFKQDCKSSDILIADC